MNLYLFPHQDDEYFVAPLLCQKPSSSMCVYLTQGDFHGKDPERRNQESRRALQSLGVNEGNCFFLSTELQVPDTRLVYFLAEVFHWTCGRFPEGMGGFQSIFVPAYEGGHPDHDAASLLGAALGLLWRVPVYEFFCYHAHPRIPYYYEVMAPPSGRKENSVLADKSSFSLKQFLLFQHYPSQVRTWLGLLPPLVAHFLFRKGVFLYPSCIKDFRHPPHPGKLYYEYRKWTSFPVFAKDSELFKKNHLEVSP